MRIFVTGATGFIGSATVKELLSAGHAVLGLARSDQAVRSLAEIGAEARRGELSDHNSLAAGARACDGVIHLAFIHDFSQFEAAIETDRRALEALVGALEGLGKPFVATFGAVGLVSGRAATEKDAPLPPGSGGHPRGASEAIVLDAARRGVRASVMRLPPSVHGAGDHGFVPMLIDLARKKGSAAYVGDGSNRWPAVHRLDAARLYRLALEKADAGTRLHAIAEEGIAMREIAETIGEGLGVPVRSLTAEEASAHFGWMARFVAIDAPTSSAITRDSFGWNPKEKGLLADMRESGYFDEARRSNLST